MLSRRPRRRGARQPPDAAVPRAGVVAQQALLPQHTDPKLWLVHTKPGAEREAVQCLLQKGVDLALRGTPLQIKSAFTQDHLKARRGAPVQAHVGLHPPHAADQVGVHAGPPEGAPGRAWPPAAPVQAHAGLHAPHAATR
jgi:hypothetical protein